MSYIVTVQRQLGYERSEKTKKKREIQEGMVAYEKLLHIAKTNELS